MKVLVMNKDKIIKYLQFCLLGVVIISLCYYMFFCNTYTVITPFKVGLFQEGSQAAKTYPSKLKFILENNAIVNIQQVFIFKNEKMAKEVLEGEIFKNSYKSYEVSNEDNKLIVNGVHDNWIEISRTEVVLAIMSGLNPFMQMINENDCDIYYINEEIGEVQ